MGLLSVYKADKKMKCNFLSSSHLVYGEQQVSPKYKFEYHHHPFVPLYLVAANTIERARSNQVCCQASQSRISPQFTLLTLYTWYYRAGGCPPGASKEFVILVSLLEYQFTCAIEGRTRTIQKHESGGDLDLGGLAASRIADSLGLVASHQDALGNHQPTGVHPHCHHFLRHEGSGGG